MRASDDLCTWLLFFFSSRRRHTRLVSDWSSDVCSSDLDKGALPGGEGCFGFLDLALQLGNRQLVGMPALGLVLLQDQLQLLAHRLELALVAREALGEALLADQRPIDQGDMRRHDHHQGDRPEQHGPLTQVHVVDPRNPGFPVEAHFFASPPPDDSTNSMNRAGCAGRVISRLEKSWPCSLSSVRSRCRYKGTSSGRAARPAMKASPLSSENRTRVSHMPSIDRRASARSSPE